jgi:hypothetical protein
VTGSDSVTSVPSLRANPWVAKYFFSFSIGVTAYIGKVKMVWNSLAQCSCEVNGKHTCTVLIHVNQNHPEGLLKQPDEPHFSSSWSWWEKRNVHF